MVHGDVKDCERVHTNSPSFLHKVFNRWQSDKESLYNKPETDTSANVQNSENENEEKIKKIDEEEEEEEGEDEEESEEEDDEDLDKEKDDKPPKSLPDDVNEDDEDQCTSDDEKTSSSDEDSEEDDKQLHPEKDPDFWRELGGEDEYIAPFLKSEIDIDSSGYETISSKIDDYSSSGSISVPKPKKHVHWAEELEDSCYEDDTTRETAEIEDEDEQTLKECSDSDGEVDSSEENSESDSENKEESKFGDSRIDQLYDQIASLQEELMEKTKEMNRLQSELDTTYDDADMIKRRFRRLKDELETCKRCNADLRDRLSQEQAGASCLGIIEEERLREAEERIQDLEGRLEAITEENERLKASLETLCKEKDTEISSLQQALTTSKIDKAQLQERYHKEFEQLRTVNSTREVMLLDDFEWKLREVEKKCKKQIQDKTKANESLITELKGKLESAEQELQQVAHLKNCEAELEALRQANQDQKRTIRKVTLQLEGLQVNEKILKEEVNKLRQDLEQEKYQFSAIQSLHKDDLAEKEKKLQLKLEAQRNQINAELNSQWEGKLRQETYRIRGEMEIKFRQEKEVAVEAAKVAKDREKTQYKEVWEKKIQDCVKEVDVAKKKLAEREDAHRKQLQSLQTQADFERLELRRKIDKLDMDYQSQIEKLQETHEKDLQKLTEDWERKVQEKEASLAMQAGSLRTTVELVKQQMSTEADNRVQELINDHQRELDAQWRRLVLEKDAAIEKLNQKHRELVEHLRNEITRLSKAHPPAQGEINSKERERLKQLLRDFDHFKEDQVAVGATALNMEEGARPKECGGEELSETNNPTPPQQGTEDNILQLTEKEEEEEDWKPEPQHRRRRHRRHRRAKGKR